MLLRLDLQDEEEYIDEHQPFPSLSQVSPPFLFCMLKHESSFYVANKYANFSVICSQIFQAVPGHVGFNIELKWITQFKVCLPHTMCALF